MPCLDDFQARNREDYTSNSPQPWVIQCRDASMKRSTTAERTLGSTTSMVIEPASLSCSVFCLRVNVMEPPPNSRNARQPQPFRVPQQKQAHPWMPSSSLVATQIILPPPPLQPPQECVPLWPLPDTTSYPTP